MIIFILTVACLAGMVGFGLGGVMAYNRGFGDGWNVADDYHAKERRKWLGLHQEVIRPGSIVKLSNGWAKFTGDESATGN